MLNFMKLVIIADGRYRMEKRFKPGDKVYHRNLKEYGTFIGYAWESEEECDVDFVMNNTIEQRHVSVNKLCYADEI